MIQRQHSPALTPRARELRRDMTPQERKLWYCFLRDYPVHFLRQKVIDYYIADFYCRAARLVVEIDGSQHITESGIAQDDARTAWLNQRGLYVLRLHNQEVEQDFTAVCTAIDYTVNQRLSILKEESPCTP